VEARETVSELNITTEIDYFPHELVAEDKIVNSLYVRVEHDWSLNLLSRASGAEQNRLLLR
jgi:hypothetical protein